jgi:hypothetical protein
VGLIHGQDFSGGWNPSADRINAPRNCFLRLDNLVLDERGVLALRPGMDCISSATPLVTNGSVMKMFTIMMDAIRYRYVQVDDGIWRSVDAFVYDQILSNFAGSGDVAMGSDLGQVFFARSTTKFKNDGSESRLWGIQQIPSAPDLIVLDSDEKEFSSFADGESPAWIATEGTVAAAVGFNDQVGSARLLTPASTTGKGSMRKIFATEQDFDTYDGGDTGVDEDLMEFYVWFSQPSNLEYFTLMIDVNGDSTADVARFRDDYYYVTLTTAEAVEMKLDPDEALEDRFDINGPDREDFVSRLDAKRPRVGGRIRNETPAATGSGWAKFSIQRGKFFRVGSTPTKNWSTVKAIQLEMKSVIGTGITPCAARFDNMRIIGGSRRALTGKYKVYVQPEAHLGRYTAKGPVSPISDEVELRSNGLRVRVTLPAGYDTQVNNLAVYLSGGTLDGFYRAAEKTVDPGPGGNTFNVNIEVSDRDILIQNQRLDPSIGNPPDGVIDIAGPFDSRLFVLTDSALYPSLPGDPDAYSADHVLTIPGRSTTAHWIRSVLARPILGTSRDIYEIVGDGSISPDGIINYAYRGLNVAPPISNFTAQDGNTLIYLASDGLRVFNGTTSIPLRGNLDLLYQFYTRYGISPPDLGSNPGRFRGGIHNRKLYVMVPEGGNTNATPYLHRYDFGTNQWDRYVLPRSMQVIYREPDGKILGGDSSGAVYLIDGSPGEGDLVPQSGALQRIAIPIQAWTPYFDGENPLNRKKPLEVRAEAITTAGGTHDILTVDGYTIDDDGNELAIFSCPVDSNPTTRDEASGLEATNPFRRIQMRFSGSFTIFKLTSWSLFFRALPTPRLFWDSGYLDLGARHDIVFLHRARLVSHVRSTNITLKAYFSDTLKATELLTRPGPMEWEAKFGRGVQGRQPRITLGTTDTATGDSLAEKSFEPYHLELWYVVAGRQTLEKKVIRIHKEQH